MLKRAVSAIVLFLFLASASAASAATYYVRTDGNNANAGTTNSAAGAFLTITKGCTTAVAGDTVRVQAGTYVATPSGCTNGTSGNPVTLVADGTVTTCGWSVSNNSYIRIIGFTFDPTIGGCSSTIVQSSGTNTGLEFWNDNLKGSNSAVGYNFDYNKQCTKCIFFGGSVSGIGNPGNDNAFNIYGNDNFIGYVDITNVCYVGIVPGGNRLRVLNVNFSGFLQCSGTHPDFFFIDGAACCGSTTGFSNSLVESVFGIGTTTSTDNKFAHQSIQATPTWNDNVWRFNVAYNMGASFYSVYDNGITNGQNRIRFYNNSLVDCNRANSGTAGDNCGNINLNAGGSVYIYNELFYQGWADNVTTNLFPWNETAGTFFRDYNLAFSPLGTDTFASPWKAQVHPQTNVDPKLSNVAGMDFTLQSASGARGHGGPLTTANGSGSNSTTLTVAANTGSFFIGSNASNLPQYGGNLVPGDFITVGSTTVQVSSVSGDTLTLASPISWNSGSPVYFGTSSTVDEGAYPYKAGGYRLSAGVTASGGTETITPSDPSLVRFVVCYSSGVPYAVINSAPYTCAVPTGTFSATLYPRYASQTRGVNAVLGVQPPAAPTGVTIIR